MRGSISRRLLVTTVGVISVAVALAGGFLLRQHHRELYRGFQNHIEVLARGLAEHCVAPLVFDDPPGALDMLTKLDLSNEVARAILFDRHGQPVATYPPPGSEALPRLPLPSTSAVIELDGYLHVFEPVMHLNTVQGTMYVVASTAGVRGRITEATHMVALAALAAIVAAGLLAWLLQRSITRPILQLAETMRGINDQSMLSSTRVGHLSTDEIGTLYSGFNRMLDQLAARERERDRSAARLRALLAALPDPVFLLDENGRIAEALAGRGASDKPTAELRGGEIAEAIGVGLGWRLSEGLARALETGAPQRIDYELDRPAGRRWYDAVLVPLAAQHGGRGAERLVLFVPRDVTERHSLELDLRQAQKMEALGRLAGGVAHDFNNILTAIMGYGSLLVGRFHREDGGGELTEIMKAAERAAALTQQLLAFSRRQMVAFRHVSLNEVVGDMQRMLERIIGEDVQLHADLARDLPLVHFDPGQLQQVILNLAVNAREAMPGGGTLTLSTRTVAQTARRAGEPELTPGRYVLLRVSDTGVGMDESVRARIFEPFFTTKGRKGGTGLGLAMVYGIVRQAGGDITVTSELQRGTTFSIYLPEAADAAEPASAETRPGPVMTRGTETVLVVEDEPQLLELACRTLSEQGYRVLTAGNARQALQLCSVHPGPIHLMVTDVVMPRMGGGELVSAARPLRPSMRVLFMSGYTDETAIQYGVAVGQVPFLQKPFTPLELNVKVREILDEVVRLDPGRSGAERAAPSLLTS
jgi:signal transduction histidine kinase